MSESEALKRAKKKYQQIHKDDFRYVQLRFNKKTDADIIEKIEEVGNIQGYIKYLIRKDIEER